MSHKCKFIRTCSSKDTIWEMCKKCEARRERLATKSETKKFLADQKKHSERCDQMHKVWHKFSKEFILKDTNGMDTFKLQGWELMEAIAEFAKKYPNDIEILGCDDSYHASSDVVLIHHRYKDDNKKTKNWGTTVVVVTQCDGQTPHTFFLYPGHMKGFIESFKKIYSIREKHA